MENTISFDDIKRQAVVKKSIESLRGSGYSIINDLIDNESTSHLNKELLPCFDDFPVGEGLFYGDKTKRFNAVFTKSKVAQALAVNPVVMAIAEEILGINCDKFQIHLTQAICILPGETSQVPHKDSDSYPIPHMGHEFMLNVMWPLTSFTTTNGATCIYPGSHVKNYSDMDLMTLEEPVMATCEPGDAIIWTGSTLHSGGANLSEQPRSGLVISYSLGWLRQAENQFLTYSKDDLSSFDQELIDLLGFAVHRPNLGWVNGDEPMKSLGFNLKPQATRDIFDNEMTERLAAFVGAKKHARN